MIENVISLNIGVYSAAAKGIEENRESTQHKQARLLSAAVTDAYIKTGRCHQYPR